MNAITNTPHPVDVRVGKTIRSKRRLAGMTQQQLAEVVGVRFQQIQKYETGANRVSASRLHDIATALGAPIATFFGGTGDHPTAGGDLTRFEAEFLRKLRTMPEHHRIALRDLQAAMLETQS